MFPTPPIDERELQLVSFLPWPVSPILLRGFSLLIHLATSYLFGRLVSEKRKFSFIGFFVFLFSPWTIYLSTFAHFQNLLLLPAIWTVYQKKALLLAIPVIASILFFHRIFPQFSLINKFRPENLKIELTQRQNIDFLSVERKFLLPYPLRLFIYNQPFYIVNSILTQFVAFFDFEQMASPNKSYDITKLSGLSPKGNLPVFYLWEIPLILVGLALTQKKKFFFSLFLIAVIPFLFFEKKLLPQTAFLTLIPLLALETIAVSKFKPLLLVSLVGAVSFYHTLLFKPLSYQTPQPYLYREIARWLAANYTPDKNFIVTTKFGPTDKMIPFYLGGSHDNLSFRQINFKSETPTPNTYYLGLSGEFVGKGRDLEEATPPAGIEVITKITGEDEPVFEYGKNIWIGFTK